MIRELFSGSALLDLPVVSTVLFLCVFVGAIVWVMRRSRKQHYDRMARMPLNGGCSNEPESKPTEEKGGAG